MSRKRFFIALVVLFVLVGVAGGFVFWGFRQVPDFYERALAREPDPIVRQQSAKQFVQRTLRLVDDLQNADAWTERFHQDQVNSWLAEELHSKYPELVPPGVEEPRVMFREGIIHIGFQYADEQFQGVVSLELRPWVPNANQLAIEIRSVKAGVIPIPLDQIVHEVAHQFETNGWRTEWKQMDGNDVVVVHLDRGHSDQPILEHLSLVDGTLTISGSRKSGIASAERFRISSLVPFGQAGGQ